MPIMQEVIERVSSEKPFKEVKLVIGHFLALNSVLLFEAFWRGGAEIVICIPFEAMGTRPLMQELVRFDFPFLPVEEAIHSGDFFIDNAGALGKWRTPKGAVEVTRTGDWVYGPLPCPTISIDKSKLKYIEDYLGTGESFVRGWKYLRPNDPLAGKNIVLFGYGKVGKGVAFFSKKEGSNLTIVDIDMDTLAKAEREGFHAVDPQNEGHLKRALGSAQIVIGATGKPNAVGNSVPAAWLRANSPYFVNIGHDEFGEYVPDDEVVGGKHVPLNFHLKRPTKNHKIDPIQAAEVLAMEALVHNFEMFNNGINPLPIEIDNWIFRKWVGYWPNEDLSGIAQEINLSRMED